MRSERRKLPALLLVCAMIISLSPITALAASATGTAYGTQGFNTIFVDLSGASEFSADATAVQNPSNWTLGVTGGAQAIASIVKTGTRSVNINLSAPIAAGNSFTVNATATVFAPGTEPFEEPLAVSITVPMLATGTAAATAGTKDIAVALTYGSFGASTPVQNVASWTLGGTSAPGNPIAGVTRVDNKNAIITLTNNIGSADVYTITASQQVFINVSVAPFAEPLAVQITAADTDPPAFAPGYPQAGAMSAAGSRKVNVIIKAQEEAYYSLVILPDGAAAPSKEQVRDGKDAAGDPALRALDSGYEYAADAVALGILPYGAYSPGHDTSYDLFVVPRDDAGNLSEPQKVDVRTPPAADFFAAGFPNTGAVRPAGSKEVEALVQVQETKTAGLVYYVLLPDSASRPSIEQISQGLDGSGAAALDAGSITCANGVAGSIIASGPADATAYDLYLVVGDTYASLPTLSCSEAVKLDVSTPAAAPNVCTISGGGSYTSLADALAVVEDAQTITLLTDINTDQGIAVSGINVILNLNGFNLVVDTSAIADSIALDVSGGGSVTLQEPVTGSFNVTGAQYGVRVSGNGSRAVVTGAVADGGSAAVYADGPGSSITVEGSVAGINWSNAVEVDGGSVVINGDITDGDYAAWVYNGGSIQVDGDITCNYTGVQVEDSGDAVIGGDILVNSASGRGVLAYSGGSIQVDGDITITGSQSIVVEAASGGTVTVNGDVQANGNYAMGVKSFDPSTVIVNGNVLASGSYAVGVWAGPAEVPGGGIGLAQINGNVTVYGAYCIGVETGGSAGRAAVSGNVTVFNDGSVGVFAHDGSYVRIGGIVDQTGDGPGAGGVYCRESQVIVDGSITVENSSQYIRIGEGWRSKDAPGFGAPDPLMPGYMKYTFPSEDETAVVWVGEGSAPVITKPTVVTGEVSGVTATGALLSGSVTSNGGATVTGRGFVYGRSASPAIGGAGVVQVAAGSGTGPFTAALSGLTAGVTYYVRAYAVNSMGASYGESVSFTTAAARPGGDNESPASDGKELPKTGAGGRGLAMLLLCSAMGAVLALTFLSGRKKVCRK